MNHDRRMNHVVKRASEDMSVQTATRQSHSRLEQVKSISVDDELCERKGQQLKQFGHFRVLE